MQEITEIAELKEIQLGILREIDKLCKAYHLKYFMSDGTLLGAVRHKGYIPWDDDLDIWMPRKDYEKLEQIMNQEDSCYKVVNHKNTKGYIYAFGKAVDTRTILKENIEVNCPMGIYVDIFPYDGQKKKKKEDYIKHVRKMFVSGKTALQRISEF